MAASSTSITTVIEPNGSLQSWKREAEDKKRLEMASFNNKNIFKRIIREKIMRVFSEKVTWIRDFFEKRED